MGLLGADGRCKLCGLAGGAGTAGAATGPGAPLDTHDDGLDASPEAAAGGGFDPKRPLCDDGACLGIITTTGTCNVCGRAAR